MLDSGAGRAHARLDSRARACGNSRASGPRRDRSARRPSLRNPHRNRAARRACGSPLPEESPCPIGDAAGTIDTLPRGGGAELELGVGCRQRARVGRDVHRSHGDARDSLALKPVLVLGAAGWESKFTIAALEERGWRVASRVRVAPNVDVTQGPLGAIDTARYSAVIALDSTAASSATAIARYAREGGGVDPRWQLLLALVACSSIAPGDVGRRIAGVAGGGDERLAADRDLECSL